MTKEEIGAVLKSLRLKTGMTQTQVAELLGRRQQIIGHWETGYAQPDANTLFRLCAIYKTSVDEAFGFKTKKPSENSVGLSSNEKLLLENFNKLNEEGQEKLLDLSADLVASGRYIKSNKSTLVQKA